MDKSKLSNKAIKAVYEDSKDRVLKDDSIEILKDLATQEQKETKLQTKGLQPGRLAKLKRQGKA